MVYLAQDTKLKRTVALKIISAEVYGNSDIKERFRREASAAARLNHPAICTVYELGRVDEMEYIVLEYVEGDTLKTRVEQGSVSLQQIMGWLIQIAEGIKAAHDEGIIHRDIKPENIMVTKDGHIKIMDFGIVRFTDSDSDLTHPGTSIGTIAYMAPEQAMGQDVDHRADIWSFGVVLYELATGKRPFDGQYPEAVLYSILHASPPLPSSINRDVLPVLGQSGRSMSSERPG